MNARNLIRWTGLAAMAAGIIFAGIQPLHPLDMLVSVTTTHWAIIQSLKTAMYIVGLLGLTGLYARQANEVGWLGLAGYLLLSLFFVHTRTEGPYQWRVGECRTFAVQLVRSFGAHVTGVCSTRNVALVHSLGADTVIDYT